MTMTSCAHVPGNFVIDAGAFLEEIIEVKSGRHSDTGSLALRLTGHLVFANPPAEAFFHRQRCPITVTLGYIY